MRVPSEEYQELKEIEDAVLNFKREEVKTYVIAAGVLYGKGEAILNQHLKKAWLQDPPKLPYVGEGKNMLPSVHVTDLARMVKKIYESKPEKQYVFAVDNTKRPTQKKLIQAISDGVGTGLTESIPIPEEFKKHHPKKTPLQLDLDWRKPLLLNLKVKPSALFVSENEEEEPVEFDWHCKQGLQQNIKTVTEEFNKKRGLKPIKIFIAGPPASGKSFYGAQLAKHYNVPHIYLPKLIDEVLQWNDEKEKEIFKKREEKKKQLEEEEKQREEEEREKELQRQKDEEERKKKRQEEGDYEDEQPDQPEERPKDADEEEEKENEQKSNEGEQKEEGEEGEEEKKKKDDESSIEPDSDEGYEEPEIKRKFREWTHMHPRERFPEELMNEAVRWRLNQNDCQNRGYVLDGYPKSYSQAKGVFFKLPERPPKPEKKEGDEEG